jgi:hypothetical protein
MPDAFLVLAAFALIATTFWAMKQVPYIHEITSILHEL